MDFTKLERRNSSLDILRIVAAFTVLSVHFFLHNGFYSEPVQGMGPIEGIVNFLTTGDEAAMHGPWMFLAVMMRTFFGVCVPLFMILTGYLMSKKELKKGYYKGVRKTVIVFILATIVCMVFKSIHETPAAKDAFYRFDLVTMFDAIGATRKYNLINFIFGTLDFTGANYSWYIEMYIGLFLIAPFLNLAYNKLNSQKQKRILVITFVAISILPTLFNIFNFQSAEWWVTPTTSDEFQKLIPAFWLSIYPVTYYFVGAYLREYGLKWRTLTLTALLCVSLFVFTVFNWFRSYGGGFKTGSYGYWYGFMPFVLAVLFFELLTRIRTDNWKPVVKLGLWKLSDLALGIYLCSFIFDELIYENLRMNVPVMIDRIPYYLLTVPLCFVASALLSFVLNVLAKYIIILYEFLKKTVTEQRALKKDRRWQDYLFIALMAFALILSFWKCRFGFGGNDEAFYLTIPHRLILGDSLFGNEWHLSQLSGFLLIPFVWLYRLTTGSTDGIIFAARIVYILMHAGATIVIYTKLRKFGFLSVFGCALYFLYTPFNIMALSYDSMGVELLLLAGVLLATADYEKKIQLIFSGLAFAGAVLCNPYLASLWLLYAACMGAHLLLKNKDISIALKSEMFSVRAVLFFTAGVAALAVVFLIFTLTRIGFGDIFANLPYMLDDPEHPHITVWNKVQSYFKSWFELHPHFRYVLYAYGAMLVAMLFDKNRKLHRSVYLFVTSACVAVTLIQLLPNCTSSTYNHIMLPFIFFGITSYLLLESKPRELLLAVFIPGIIYSFCIHMSSNQVMYCISMAMTVTNVASMIFLGCLIAEMRETPDNITYANAVRCVTLCSVAAVIALQAGVQITSKTFHVFWDSAPEQLTTEISSGPAEGILTTDGNAQAYETVYADISDFMNRENGNILFLTPRTWTYLAMNDFGYATYSAWLPDNTNNTLERLQSYFELNPDKVPRYIYIPKDTKFDAMQLVATAQAKGYTMTETTESYHLERAN